MLQFAFPLQPAICNTQNVCVRHTSHKPFLAQLTLDTTRRSLSFWPRPLPFFSCATRLTVQTMSDFYPDEHSECNFCGTPTHIDDLRWYSLIDDSDHPDTLTLIVCSDCRSDEFRAAVRRAGGKPRRTFPLTDELANYWADRLEERSIKLINEASTIRLSACATIAKKADAPSSTVGNKRKEASSAAAASVVHAPALAAASAAAASVADSSTPTLKKQKHTSQGNA